MDYDPSNMKREVGGDVALVTEALGRANARHASQIDVNPRSHVQVQVGCVLRIRGSDHRAERTALDEYFAQPLEERSFGAWGAPVPCNPHAKRTWG
jgi:hypothetical protein